MCETKFVLKKFASKNTKFCSIKCRSNLYYQKYYQHFLWKKERQCKQCGNKFVPNNPRQIGCSKICSKRFTRKSWKKRNWRKVLDAENARAKKKARMDWHEKECKSCGKRFLPNLINKHQQLFCGIVCREKYFRKWENLSEYRKAKKRHDVGERAHRVRANGGKFTFQEWEQMKKDYNYTCQICKRKEPEIKLVRDHIFPIVKGGKHCKENIQPLCISCNCRKHDN